MKFFDAPGLTGESYYRTRRSELRATLVVLFGLAAALYAGVTEFMRLVYGVQSDEAVFGLSDYMFEVITSTALWALAGALLAWPIGVAWERWHRAHRRTVYK